MSQTTLAYTLNSDSPITETIYCMRLGEVSSYKAPLSNKADPEIAKSIDDIALMVNEICSSQQIQNQVICIKNIQQDTTKLSPLSNPRLVTHEKKPSSSSTFIKLPKQIKVLLVEDDLLIQKVHRMMLERLGCAVDIAADGYKALELAGNHYDVIIMDIGLPGMDGIETSAAIRQKQNINNQVPIIAITAFGNDVAEECASAGINEVAAKPVKSTELNRLLQKWIDFY